MVGDPDGGDPDGGDPDPPKSNSYITIDIYSAFAIAAENPLPTIVNFFIILLV